MKGYASLTAFRMDFFNMVEGEIDTTKEEHGPHPSREFGACRVAEEAGELVQALTSVTRDRRDMEPSQRYARAYKEAVQTVAMVMRTLEEFWEQSPATDSSGSDVSLLTEALELAVYEYGRDPNHTDACPCTGCSITRTLDKVKA